MSYLVNDVVHGEIALPGYVEEIINTAEFQRLRNLKQLGVSNFVFASAKHSRAEHCIGTAHLCKKLLDALQNNSDKTIDELHKKCVVLAGLLHDLGHGPFSHLWEGVVHEGIDTTWTHEQQSVNMIEHLISINNIKIHPSPDVHNKALRLMTSLITGDSETWDELLQPHEMFITEIVSNKFCNIDVDKVDYILRDNHHVKDHVTLKPFEKFLDQAKIIFDDHGISHIGYYAKDFNLIENLFFNRAYLHMNIYQHKRVAGAERMVKDICCKGDAGGVTISELPLTEVHLESDAYLKLDDSVLDLIEKSEPSNEMIKTAQNILRNLNNSRLYEMVWESVDDNGANVFEVLVKKFGSIFVNVGKFIPSAEVPTNIPLYNDAGENVKMSSDLRLSYKSSMIFCVDPDVQVIENVNHFIDSLNNNL